MVPGTDLSRLELACVKFWVQSPDYPQKDKGKKKKRRSSLCDWSTLQKMETVELGNGRSPGIEDRKTKGNAWAQGQWCQDMLGARKVLQLLLWEMQMEQKGQNSVAISEHQERHHRTQSICAPNPYAPAPATWQMRLSPLLRGPPGKLSAGS